MNIDTWLLFCIAELALCFSPGPAVLYVLSQGLGSGFRASASATGGIISGNTLYFIISATGLGALVLASHNIFLVAKWLGTAFLIWLGLQYLIKGSLNLNVEKARDRTLINVFNGALILQLANPKTIVFFMAILPQFISLEYSLPKQMLILGITSIIIETGVLLSYGALGSQIETWAASKNNAYILNWISGAALILVALSLALIEIK